MDPESDIPAPIQSMNFIKTSGRVVVALRNGRIFLCQSNLIPVSKIGGEGTFILTELGTSDSAHSITSLQLSENRVEIWCGQSQVGNSRDDGLTHNNVTRGRWPCSV